MPPTELRSQVVGNSGRTCEPLAMGIGEDPRIPCKTCCAAGNVDFPRHDVYAQQEVVSHGAESLHCYHIRKMFSR